MVAKNRVWTIENNDYINDDISKLKNLNNDKKIYSKSTNNWFVDSIKCFCSTTSLHGYGYLVRNDTTRGQKLAWLIIIIIAFIIAIILLWVSWNWNKETPTVTVIESTHFATWNVPFPAITICNFNKISKRLAIGLATKLKRPSNITVQELAEMFRLILDFQGSYEIEGKDYMKLHEILETNNRTVSDVMREISPRCPEMLLRCMWKGTQTRCDTLFQSVNTTEGVCCSFNYHALATNNYPVKLAYSIPKVARRVTACGYQTGLTVLLNPQIDEYFATYLSSYGFRILIRNSNDYPDENAETKVLTASREGFISISPESTYATDNTKDLNINVRNCLFDNEKKLNVMKYYSYTNCLAECRTNIVYEICGCVPLNVPNNGSLPACKMNQINCVIKNRKLFVGALPGLNMSLVKETGVYSTPCNCLPDCELLQYPAEITSGILNRKFSYNNDNLFKDIIIENKSLLHVYFNDLVSTRYRKDIYQTWIGSLASFGGLLGLILGFSIITGIEFIYYITIRPLFDYISKK